MPAASAGHEYRALVLGPPEGGEPFSAPFQDPLLDVILLNWKEHEQGDGDTGRTDPFDDQLICGQAGRVG